MIESWNIHMNGRFSMKNIEITGHTPGVLRRPFRQLTVLLLVFATMGLETWSVAGQTQARPATVVRPLRMVPAQPATASPLTQDARGEAAAPSAPSAIRIDDEPRIGADEAARLKQIYDALPPEEQAAMRNFYESMEIDLLALFMTEPSVAGRPQPLLPLVTRKNFARTPQTVLAARTRLGLVQQDRPEDAATPAEVAEWLHMNVMAGEWQVLEWFLAERAGDEAPGIYSHVIQSTNQGDPMLLPEEVLALANAASGEPTDWQIDVLGQLLKQASTRSSTGPMLGEIRSGTRLFGGADESNHPRTAALLARAGMPDEAYLYLPPIDRVREQQDARGLLIHGLYHADRDETLRAWELFGELALIEDADFKLRQEALRAAVKRLPEVPEAQATAWLEAVFASERLAPAALEVIALDAMLLGESSLSETERARSILVMKSAVETLLDSGRVDSRVIRVPLRMLTIGLVAEAEAATNANAVRGGPPPGVAMLMRAMPEENWLDSIEPSLAVRAYRAFTGVATRADEIDVALDILETGISKYPDEAEEMGEEFLGLWVNRLRPNAGSSQNAAIQAAIFAYGGRVGMAAAPLTRGRQARNLDRLLRVLDLVGQRGVDPKALPGVVEAFQACHSQSEAYTEADIVRILGPLDELPPATAARLAAAMQGGLSGDWRSREVQQRFGMRRNGAEIAQVVEDGYALAMRLIERALEEEPDSWQHAVRRAALAYERLEHRRSTNDRDLADYDRLRDESFDSFEQAAQAYAAAAGRGEEKPSTFVFEAWFNTAIGATNLSEVTRDNILFEGSERDEQIERIRATILAMEPALAEEHLGLLASKLVAAIDSLNPEVKPRVVRHALRIVGDHPSAAPLRRINALYEDLIDNEIHLRLALDGPDRVGTEEPFAVVVSLRYTNAVDRETDGFAKYLQNGVYVNLGNRGTSVNYRDRLEQSIRNSLSKGFEIDGIGFFDSMHPSVEVRESEESGWQEKPLAYVVLRATDPSIERIPPVRMDLDFIDQTGPVILAIESNSPPVDAATSSQGRPIRDLAIEQIVDARNAGEEVTLEITASGRGVIGDLDDLLAGVDSALAGYRVADDGIEAHPFSMTEAAVDEGMLFRFSLGDEEEQTFAGPDADGIHRQATERRWTVRYVPEVGATTSGDFVIPVAMDGVAASLNTRRFDDMDLVPVTGGVVGLGRGIRPWAWGVLVGAVAVFSGVWILFMMRKRGECETTNELQDLLPSRWSPFASVAALKRIDERYGDRLAPGRRGELRSTITEIERRYFGPVETSGESDLEDLVRAWVREAAPGR
ncbi:MAG: hypothetical protein O3A19_05845 [Planctomycetota bacterium]|nr:hypothetical protein [Planctomycetota bacterium]MDA1025934.1 hypothetical protein [Planctomycetota bacterium]